MRAIWEDISLWKFFCRECFAKILHYTKICAKIFYCVDYFESFSYAKRFYNVESLVQRIHWVEYITFNELINSKICE